MQISELPTLASIDDFRSTHHSLQLGVSLNFVFGEAARRSKEIMKL